MEPATALAWSEARVNENDFRRPSIALWRPAGVSAAIGIGQNPEVELAVADLRRDGVGLVRRQSGGGAVLLYRGVLCWEAMASLSDIGRMHSEGSGIRQSYATLTRPVIDGLSAIGVDAFQAGICDVSVSIPGSEGPCKIAGTAQLRRKDTVLVHGSLLVDPDLDLLSRYLAFPSEQPEYRRNRSHRDFCVSVAEYLGEGLRGDELVERVADAIVAAARSAGWEALAPSPGAAAEELERRKYLSDAWNWERVRPS